MNIFIDIIGSWFVRASMIVVALTLMVNMNDALYKRTTKANARMVYAWVDSLIYADVSRACYDVTKGFTHSDSAFLNATASAMEFWADTSDVSLAPSYRVKYFTSYDVSTGRYSLYRQELKSPYSAWSSALLLGSKFTQASFKYYTAAGDSVTSLPYGKIRRIRVLLGSVAQNLGTPDSTISSDFTVFPSRLF